MPPFSKQKRKTKDQPRTANVITFTDDNSLSNSFGNNPCDDPDFGDDSDNSSGSGDNINDISASNGDGNSDDNGEWDDPEEMEAEIKLNQRLKNSVYNTQSTKSQILKLDILEDSS
ncbi:14894_t:CDS:2, partial [Funneliformis geosporum]